MDYEFGQMYLNVQRDYVSQLSSVAFVIGRFQPFHNGHKALIEEAFKYSEKVVVFVGSVQESRTAKNPFTFEERKAMILSTFGKRSNRLIVVPLIDTTTNELWVEQIKQTIGDLGYSSFYSTFICCNKDEETTKSNEILDCFHTIPVDQPTILNATDIRKQLFEENISPYLIKNISTQTQLILNYLGLKIKANNPQYNSH